MLFAVVDIETTGGYAAQNGITEISVFITDGSNISDSFYAILNPEVPIPPFIETLTGITNEQVKDKPVFSSVAAELYGILKDKVFVAHNVNFDFSFLNYHLNQNGFDLENKKLCTIRLSRRVIPGLKGYGLDKICNHLGIRIENRHSAAGDAHATVELLHLLIGKGGMKYINQMINSAGDRSLPPNVTEEAIKQLPQSPGVYFFHDKKGKVVYVGKAKNIMKRVKSHFYNNKITKQKQEFLKSVYRFSYRETATELMAGILEEIEIKKIWPRQNKSQKHFRQLYGLYTYTDSNGYLRLFVEKRLKHTEPVYFFNNLTEGYALLRKLIKEYSLCPYLCFLTKDISMCRVQNPGCGGACTGAEPPEVYNLRVNECIEEFSESLPSFAIIDKGIDDGQKSCILIEKGRFSAMGYLESEVPGELEELKERLSVYSDNVYVRSLVFRYAEAHPYQILSFSGMSFSR